MLVKKVASKYGAKRVQIDGITFSSMAESRRYIELKQLEAAGHISKLELQPRFELAPSVKYTGSARAKPALRYTGDFAYVDHLGKKVIEDVKGFSDRSYEIRKHLMLAIHGIEIKEVRSRGKKAGA